MAAKIWAGLDVGTEKTSVCVIDDAGQIMQEAVCWTNVKDIHAAIRWIKRRRYAAIGLEASGGSVIARGLRTLGYSVTLYETRQLSKFLRVRRNKTDAGDAIGIAEAGRIGASLVSRVHLKSLECQTLQSRLTLRRHLISERVSSTNVLIRQLGLFGGTVRRSSSIVPLVKQAEGEMKSLFGKVETPLTAQFRQLLDRCERLFAAQVTLDRELKACAKSIEVCRRFMEIPGVGPICALSFYALVGDPHRFRSYNDIGPYLGLTPRVHQSGLRTRVGRISKMGNREVRALLVGSSLKFMRSSPPDSSLREWAKSVEQRSGRGKARVALARKLATIMIALWKNGSHYAQYPTMDADNRSHA